MTMDLLPSTVPRILTIYNLEFDDEENEKPQTVNGWVQLILEGIPDEGDSFVHGFLSVEVTKCDEKMVKEIVVRKIAEKDKDADSEDDK